MNRKLICFDLDGTLLNSAKQISPLNLQMLVKLNEAGHLTAIATGRLYKSAVKLRNGIPAKLDIICSNGAVVESGGRIIRREQIPPRELALVWQLAQKHDVALAFHSLHAAYLTRLGWTFLMHHFSNVVNQGNLTIRNIHVRDLQEYMRYSPFYINGSVISRRWPDRVAALRRDLEELELFNIEAFAPDNVEIIPRQSNKGTGALLLAQRYGIAQEDIIAFGDSENDLKLIRSAGLGVAMDNACSLLKNHADQCIGDNNSNAIALFLAQRLNLELDERVPDNKAMDLAST